MFFLAAPVPICPHVTLIEIFRSYDVDGEDLDVGGADEGMGSYFRGRGGTINSRENHLLPFFIIHEWTFKRSRMQNHITHVF